MTWKIVSASVTGKSHLDQNLPCQDAHCHAVVQEVLLAAVCDGAGSATHSETGATFLSQQVVHGLSALVNSGVLTQAQPMGEVAFTESLREVIGRARAQLLQKIMPSSKETNGLDQVSGVDLPAHPAPAAVQRSEEAPVPTDQGLALKPPRTAPKTGVFENIFYKQDEGWQQQQQQQQQTLVKEPTLRDFACTLVGCVVSSGGGFFFHIGDGFAIHQQASGQAQLSLPENGEYADETYFVTDDNWHDHLRITPIEAPTAESFIGLMSDGPAPFAVNKTKTAFYLPFIEPVMRYLRGASASEGCLALKNLLENEKTHHITADDKSLLLAFQH